MNLTENPPIQSLPPYMRVTAIRASFGIPDRMTWAALASGELKGSKKGKLWFVETASVFKLLKKYRNIQTSAEPGIFQKIIDSITPTNKED